jgi:cytochrome c
MLRCLLVFLTLGNPAAAQEFFTLKGHGGPIMGIATGPNNRVATASFDNAVGLWNGDTPNWQDGHEAAVNTVIFDTQGGVVSGGDDYSVRRWADGHGTILWTHKAKVMGLAVQGDLIASASWDATVGVGQMGGDVRYFHGHTQGVNDVAFTDDGTQIYSASTDGTIRIWDVETGVQSHQLLKHGFGVNTLILNDEWLAYGAIDGVTRIVNATTGHGIADFTLERRPILAMALSPDKTHLAVGDGEGFIMVIDTEKWRIIKDFRAAKRGPIWALAFSENGQNIHAGGLDNILYSWPLETLTDHGQMTTDVRSFLKDPDKMSNGERQFQRKCSICHTLSAGSARRAGPTLYGVFGRRAGTVADYKYSTILNGSDIVWSEITIDALFDEGPDHYIPGTKMPMQRIAKPQDRVDLITFLREATGVED